MAREQQLLRLGALQERSVAPEVTVAAAGSFQGRICDVKQVPGRSGGGVVTFDSDQNSSRAGCVTWDKSRIVPGQALRRGTGPGSFQAKMYDVKQVPGSFWWRIHEFVTLSRYQGS